MSNLLPKIVLIPLVDLVIADAKPIVSIFQSNFKSEQISCDDWAIGELIGKPIQEVIHTMCHRSRANCSEDKILTLTKNITHQLNAYFGTVTNTAYSKEVDLFLETYCLDNKENNSKEIPIEMKTMSIFIHLVCSVIMEMIGKMICLLLLLV